jgi:hypothetical protein
MRLRNATDQQIRAQLGQWIHPKGGAITMNIDYEPGEWTEELDPEDPIVKRLMESGLKPVHMPDWWAKLLKGMPF